MSGIAGIVRRLPTGVSVDSLGRMAGAIRHRGPDGHGFYIGQRVGLAHVRLSVTDIARGVQPVTNEDGQLVVTFDGAIYNHPELRRELQDKGHSFRTRSDAEVLAHGYEEWGANLLGRLNGQFALAIYDRNAETLFIARDRFGVRPFFYAQQKGDFVFGSEIKALFASGEIEPSFDCRGLDEVFSFSAARAPRTPFAGVASLQPGTYGILKDGALWLRSYYEIDYPESGSEPVDAVEQLDEIILRSVGIRLRADVSVGAYMNGRLDSSVIASLAASASPQTLRSFSCNLSDSQFNEDESQRDVIDDLGTIHSAACVTHESVAQSFPDVAWHSETPVLSSDAAHMFHLAKLTTDSGIKVILSGDGADEVFLGSDVFKEDSVRRFCMSRPASIARQRLFDRLHHDAPDETTADTWRQSLLNAADPADPLFSHMPRFVETGTARNFYAGDFKSDLASVDVLSELKGSLPVRYFGWTPLNRASYLEMTTRLSPYVLATHGDRMAMAHGVETRYPFLDHRLFEFAAALPTSSRLLGLRENEVLRRWASRILPAARAKSQRRPRRTPMVAALLGPVAPGWVRDHLAPAAIVRAGVFAPSAVTALVQRCRQSIEISRRDSQALLGILSTQLVHHHFIEHFPSITPLSAQEASVVIDETTPAFI